MSKRELLAQRENLRKAAEAAAEAEAKLLIQRATDGDSQALRQLFALLEAEAEAEAEEERQRVRDWEAQQQEQFDSERRRGKRIKALMTLALQALGFTRHSRSWWTRSMKAIATNGKPASKAEISKRIKGLIEKCAWDGDNSVAELRRAAAQYPAEFADEIGDSLATLGKLLFAEHSIGEDPEYQYSHIARLNMLADELAGPDPSPARRLCAEFCAFAHAESWFLRISAAAANIRKEHPLSLKRRARADRTFLASLRTLAQITQAETRPRRMTVRANGESIFPGRGLGEIIAQIGQPK